MKILGHVLHVLRKPAVENTGPQQIGIQRILRLLIQFTSGQRRVFAMAGVLLIIEAATAVLVPLVVAYVINYMTARLAQLGGKSLPPPLGPLEALGLPILIDKDIDAIVVFTCAIVLLTMINSLADSLAEILLAKGGRLLGFNLRVGLFSHLQRLSLAFYDQQRTGDLLTRITSDVAALENFVVVSLSDFTGSILLIIFILISMVINAWQVALVTAVVIPIVAWVANYYTQRIKSASITLRSREGELASAAQEMLTSIRVVQTYGRGGYDQERFADQSHQAVVTALEVAGHQARFSWVVSVLQAIAISAIIWLGVWLIFRSPLTIGVGLLAAFVRYIQDMFKPTRRIIKEWNMVGKIYASVERIGEVLARQPAVQDEPGAIQAPPLQGDVEFRNVSFAYQLDPQDATHAEGTNEQKRLALKEVSFHIAPGDVLALVGHTGAGKSTIAQLLPRLYDPQAGKILTDGHDIREFTLDSLRSQISMVLQETILFSGSVAANIAYGRTDATREEIITAANQANAHEFIEKLPEGYDSLLGERGTNLSGGQRQRIAIARAFIRNTPILILDEPTTGLDAESANLVLVALRTLMKGKTTIIISHDFNLIRHADRIVVIRQGEIEEAGAHQSLLEAGGLYASLYFQQFGQVKDVKVERVADIPKPGAAWVHIARALQPRSPDMATAFDAEAMREQLQTALFDHACANYTIERCAPGKAAYLAEHRCFLRYGLEVRDTTSGQMFTPLVNAQIFRDPFACESYLHDRLIPLAAQMRGREEIAPFAAPVATLEPLKMAVSVFPIDGELPTLITATSRQYMIEVLRDALHDALGERFAIEDRRLELSRYARQHRCVLRYQIEARSPAGNTAQGRTVYGKVDADGCGMLAGPVIAALRERVLDHDSAFRFNIPRCLGFRPELQLLLLEAIPGEPQVARLLKSRLSGKEGQVPGTLTLEEAVDASARVAAALHTSGITLGHRRTLDDDIAWLRHEIRAVRRVSSDLGTQLRSWLDQIADYAERSDALPFCFSHGDFTYSQLIFDGKESGLVDFDTVCQAEPALDLGQFLAYQRLAILKNQYPASPVPAVWMDQLCTLFLDTYISVRCAGERDEERLRTRVFAYEVISLLRLALHSWQKLKVSRLDYVTTLLEERLSCLP